ncbi:MAG: glutamyl-tRNA reductase [Deltaproteobacteria bacterium]|jgi:glutamyl-tRNA reductase|nr:glutamyl-tRNA reductase [Deltaproteobacteria bacterium]
MDILISGVSHRAAPVEVREKLAKGELNAARLFELLTAGTIKEGLVLSTCNRLEIVVATDDSLAAQAALLNLMATASGLSSQELHPYVHYLTNLQAVNYLFRVTAGLDSQVIGEAQILGQVKEAYRAASHFRTVGPLVSKLFHKSFQAAKRVRNETEVAYGAVSIASAAVETAQATLGSLAGLTAMVLGTGEMAYCVTSHLKNRGLSKLIIAGRTSEHVKDLAKKHSAQAFIIENIKDLKDILPNVDILAAAVAVVKPVITVEILPNNVKKLLILDLGVPRNVSELVGKLPDVQLKNIDDLKGLVNQNLSLRQLEAQKAEEIIAQEVLKFSRWLKSLATSPTIKDLINLAEEARMVEMERTRGKVNFDPEQLEAVEAMSRALVRRLLHNPLTFLKGSHRHERQDYFLNMFRRLFGLDP